MSIWNKDLREKAVYYAASQNHRTRDGRVRVLAGVQIKCNYNDTKVDLKDANKNVFTATIHMATNQALIIGSIVWLGALRDIPSPITDLYEVVDAQSVKDVKRKQTRREYLLAPYSDSLPEITTVA